MNRGIDFPVFVNDIYWRCLMFKSIRNPDLYHGKNKKGSFFEGWYFKIVHPSEDYTYCFIPGIFISSNKEHTHSFIQIVKGHEADYKYIRFKKEEFEAGTDEFHVSIGKNLFSINEMSLNIDEHGESISGKISFKNIIRWPDSIINPGSMGFYNYLKFMQCYSQVCAVDGYIEGSLNIDGRDIDFTGGKVYIEKNWGEEFPYSYIWMQGNSFEKENAAITCSIGHIPFPFGSFTGFLIGMYANDKFYKFTTINRSSISIDCSEEKISLETENKEASLKVEAEYKNETLIDLYAPRNEKMVSIAKETLQGRFKATLYDKKRDCIVLSDYCHSVGIEFLGNYGNLAWHKKK